MKAHKIVLLDDDPTARFAVRDFLELKGFAVEEADSCRACLEVFRAARPDAAILDYQLPDGNALELLPRLREFDPEVPLIILTGHGSIDLAVRAMKEGAENFLTKPVELPVLLVVVERLLESRRDRRKQLASRTRQSREEIDPFLGESAAMRELEKRARRVASADSAVLIQGETGTGKGVLAAWLHRASPRAEESFVDLNCAGLSREFLETELFGHEKGAFTGAVASKAGLLEIAHRGTVFLDEIGDVSAEVQPKLLKVLEERRFRRLGDVRERQVDVRLIAATHHDLARLVREGKFRRDLYFRINTLPLRIPPLRERAEDIPALAHRLLEHFAACRGPAEIKLDAEAEAKLQSYEWPGNIRELRNVLERAVLLSEADTLGVRDLHFDAGAGVETWTDESDLTLEELERRHIRRVLQEEHGHVENAARRLNIPRSSLYQKIKRYGLNGVRNLESSSEF